MLITTFTFRETFRGLRCFPAFGLLSASYRWPRFLSRSSVMNNPIKTCSKCKKTKPVENFHKHKIEKDGLKCWCKECCNKISQKWRRENPKRIRDSAKKYRVSHRGEIIKYSKQYRKSNQEKLKEYSLLYNATHKEEKAANCKTQRAKLKGKLLLRPCGLCGATKDILAHHDDYKNPLAVRWLCRSCHAGLHSILRRKERKIV